MLKQQTGEDEQRTVSTFLPQPVLPVEANQGRVTHLPPRRKYSCSKRLLAPFLLSRRQAAFAFGLPILFVIYMIAYAWLFPGRPTSDTAAFLSVFTILLPIWICLSIGYSVRRLRLALFFGAFMALMFDVASHVCMCVRYHYPVLSMGPSWLQTDILFLFMFAGAFLTLLGAAGYQIKNGRGSLSVQDTGR